MAISLTPQDVARLMSEPSPDLRVDLAEQIAVNLAGTGLTPSEVTIAQDIVRILARDVAERVRGALAHNLRNSPNLPHDVALRLAKDVETIALPLLAESLVLTDDDLLELVRTGSSHRQEAIAARPNLSEAVSDGLITHASAPAIVVLMANETAQIADHSFDRAVSRFADNDSVKQAMVLRDRLPLAVSERLVTLVSREFQELLLKKHALSPEIASDIVLRCREQEILHLSTGAADEELHRMVTQMQHNGRLTPTLMLRALCTGDIAFFEAAMAVKGDVPIANAQILIHEASRRGLAALFRKATMPEALFGAVRAAIDVVDETGFDGNERDLERFRARVITRVLTMAGSVNPADADYLIDKLGDVLVHAPNHEAAPGPMVAA